MSVLTSGPRGLYPDHTFLAQDVVPHALIFQLATIAGSIQGDSPAVRVPYVKEDPTAGFVPEGNEIPLNSPDLDEIEVRTQKIAHLTRQSNEAATSGEANELIAESLARAVIVKANNALMNNTAGAPTGLLATAGIVDAGQISQTAGNLDAIVDAITAVEANGGVATHITTDPTTWGTLSRLKEAAGSNRPLLGAPAEQLERKLFGLPVIVSAQVPTGNVLVSDRSAIIAAVGELNLTTSGDAYFASDSLARRVTWRVGWGVVRPNRLARVTLEPGEPGEPDDG